MANYANIFSKYIFSVIIKKLGEDMLNIELGEKRVTKADIRSYYESGFKPVDDVKIGLEYERLPIFEVTGENVPYSHEYGICNLLRKFATLDNWDYITDDFNIIGLKKDNQTITLEPGAQIEYSLAPVEKISQIKDEIEKLDNIMSKLLDDYGISLINYGVSPFVTYKNINLIPKHRYKIMAKYLWGILSDVMMRETAGIQCCIDYTSEEDASRKFVLANKIVPFMTAMLANSPIRGGVETGYKSFRALSWLNTDNDRCGFAFNLDEEFSFDTYIDKVLKTPIIFLNKEDLPLEMNGRINFATFLDKGFEGFEPSLTDYKLHANLCFPEVRLNKFIEIRNQDCVNKDLLLASIAMYKGLLYSSSAMDEVEELFKAFKHLDFSEMRYEVPRYALQSRIGHVKVVDIAKELYKIAEKSLKSQRTGEVKYLTPLKQYVMKGITPADVILKNWHGAWNKDAKKLLRYLVKESSF